MKYLPLLGALLLSASPALADGFVYLKCESKGFNEAKNFETNKTERRVIKSHFQYWKVDVANSRLIEAGGDVWDTAKIVNGVAIEEWEKPRNKDGISLSSKFSIQIDPPGPLFLHSISRGDFGSYAMVGTGMCKGIDASVFEKAVKESES